MNDRFILAGNKKRGFKNNFLRISYLRITILWKIPSEGNKKKTYSSHILKTKYHFALYSHQIYPCVQYLFTFRIIGGMD